MCLQAVARHLLERVEALLRGMPEIQALGQQAEPSGAFASLDTYATARYVPFCHHLLKELCNYLYISSQA